MTRVATVDIGTNTVLLLVAERAADGEVRPLLERATITRLGEGVDASRALAPRAIERTLACLDTYAADVRALAPDGIAVVGTSAMRDAYGGDVVRAHVAQAFGVEARVLSGEDEARMTFAGAVLGLGLARGAPALVFDVGGGSTEIVGGAVGHAPTLAASADIGSVRLTERHVRSDPPARAQLDAIERDIRAALDAVALPEAGEAIGVAGTMTTIAAVALGQPIHVGARVHGARMSVDDVRRTAEALAKMPLEARRHVPGMEPLRADVIVAGALIAVNVLERARARVCVISDRGVRWGLAEELLSALSA